MPLLRLVGDLGNFDVNTSRKRTRPKYRRRKRTRHVPVFEETIDVKNCQAVRTCAKSYNFQSISPFPIQVIPLTKLFIRTFPTPIPFLLLPQCLGESKLCFCCCWCFYYCVRKKGEKTILLGYVRVPFPIILSHGVVCFN